MLRLIYLFFCFCVFFLISFYILKIKNNFKIKLFILLSHYRNVYLAFESIRSSKSIVLN